MKILYKTNPDSRGWHETIRAIYDADFNKERITDTAPLSAMTVDEEDNHELCLDLYLEVNRAHRDIAGDLKYYVIGGELHSVDGWNPDIPFEEPIVP